MFTGFFRFGQRVQPLNALRVYRGSASRLSCCASRVTFMCFYTLNLSNKFFFLRNLIEISCSEMKKNQHRVFWEISRFFPHFVLSEESVSGSFKQFSWPAFTGSIDNMNIMLRRSQDNFFIFLKFIYLFSPFIDTIFSRFAQCFKLFYTLEKNPKKTHWI